MTALWIVLGVLALICLLLSSPVSLHFYGGEAESPRLYLRIWWIPFRLLPPRPKKEKPEKPSSDTPKSKDKEKKKPALLESLQTTFEEDGVGAAVHWLGELAALVQSAIGRLLRAVTVKQLRFHLRVSGEDPAAVAVRYGEICATVYPVLAVISNGLRIKKQEVSMTPDFLSERMAYLIDIRVRLSLWRIVGAALRLMWDIQKMDSAIQETTERTV